MICQAGILADVNGKDNIIRREESQADFAQYKFNALRKVAVKRDNETEQITGLREVFAQANDNQQSYRTDTSVQREI